MTEPDFATLAASIGASVITGGGLTAWLAKQVFGGMKAEIHEIKTLLTATAKQTSEKHEAMLERVVKAEAAAAAAHRRLDEMPHSRRR